MRHWSGGTAAWLAMLGVSRITGAADKASVHFKWPGLKLTEFDGRTSNIKQSEPRTPQRGRRAGEIVGSDIAVATSWPASPWRWIVLRGGISQGPGREKLALQTQINRAPHGNLSDPPPLPKNSAQQKHG
ncbi:hypothetical protein SRHO_G00086860 [Serrasalmus rhombeus]